MVLCCYMAKLKNNTRQKGVTMESLDSKLDLVLEMVGSNTEDITDLKVTKKSVEAIQEDVQVIKIGIEFIKQGFKKKVDMEEFAVLEKRVSMLENRSR